MIRMNDVTRQYGDFTAVDAVSLDIEAGEIIGLLGHNGAGKTTLLKMLTGFLEPSSGSIEIDGHDILDERQAIQKDIGYLPENCPLYADMEVATFLDHVASLHGIEEQARGQCIAEALRLTELEERAWQRIDTLSRGLRQRVGVAQAILNKPRLLILDEPTNGLDPTQIQHMRTLIRNLARSSTVIISTHILQEVQATCDRVIIIRNGSKVVDARIEELQHGRRLLFSTDAPEETLSRILEQLPAWQALADKHPHYRNYAMTFADNDAAEKAAPVVASQLIKAGQQLYGLQIEARSLETIFGEISAGAAGGQA